MTTNITLWKTWHIQSLFSYIVKSVHIRILKLPPPSWSKALYMAHDDSIWRYQSKTNWPHRYALFNSQSGGILPDLTCSRSILSISLHLSRLPWKLPFCYNPTQQLFTIFLYFRILKSDYIMWKPSISYQSPALSHGNKSARCTIYGRISKMNNSVIQ